MAVEIASRSGGLRAHCSRCGGIRNCDVRGSYAERGYDEIVQWETVWELIQCRGCDYVFVRTVSTNSEDYVEGYDAEGEPYSDHRETIRYWPALSKRARPDWVINGSVEGGTDELLNDALSETYGALDNDLHMLAAVGIRTTFDVASELLGIDSNSTFKEKLNELVVRGHIGKVDEGRLETLVEMGNASAHRGWRPLPDDLETMITVLEQFLFEAIVLPTRRNLLNEQAAKAKATVPKRGKKKSTAE